MTTRHKHHEHVNPPAQARTPATIGSFHGILERWRNSAHRISAKTTIPSTPEQIPIGRFSTGMERITATPSTLRLGSFSDGQAPPLTRSSDQFGRFADGQVARPDAVAGLRIGSFADGYSTAARSRSTSPGPTLQPDTGAHIATNPRGSRRSRPRTKN
jgi:hypothetical protein